MAARMMRIVIFAKAPVPGKVKTRLIPALGAEGAAGLAKQMLFTTCREALLAGIGKVELCFAHDPAWSGDLPSGVKVTDQGPGHLGERLTRAASRVTSEGDGIIFIGTDCPSLDARRIANACHALDSNDAVLLPTFDGGYALVGINRFDPSIFDGIAWSTSSVATDTIARFRALGWSLHIGDMLRDIDEPEDLSHLARSSEEA
ncbi:MAG: TIGR04282 family arsenosugar biosynthesis glycosyltransferase [Sphingosinicella sp.]|nr:TIGR04282 family arsenosugar biosynthesis glycosyltransferase [Sphingosinicella sp.]